MNRSKLLCTFIFLISVASAQGIVLNTTSARLVIREDGVFSSLRDLSNDRELLSSPLQSFAAVRKGGQLFPISSTASAGAILTAKFGGAGVEADFRISVRSNCFLVELLRYRGSGVQEIRLMQFNSDLPNFGGVLSVRSDDRSAVSLLGLSQRVHSRLEGNAIVSSMYPGFSSLPESVALVATRTPDFLKEVRTVEQKFGLPSPEIGGAWAKVSNAVRTNYLFTDLTYQNVDETIKYAKLGGFQYILIYADVWAASLGSYPVNLRNFPRGEESLKAVIAKCHAAGLRVGMHMLTSFISKRDILVRPKPSPGLLKDASTMLSQDIDENANEIFAIGDLAAFPNEPGIYGPARDIQIDDEIIHYGRSIGSRFTECIRGFAGTKPASHRTGARVSHLVERVGSYLGDLATPIGDLIAERVAGLINRCHFDMIYFDGGEVNSQMEPGWYRLGEEQTKIWEKSRRELLVQGSGISSWAWHIFSRGTSDDSPAVAVKSYLDRHKIADSWRAYRDDFLPAELGWAGIFSNAPEHSATTPDEIELYAVRMIALNSAVSFETNIAALNANRRTDEILNLLRRYEQLRLAGTVPAAVRKRLSAGEWHLGSGGEFQPITYDRHELAVPGTFSFRNTFEPQPLKFRIQVLPSLSKPEDPGNIVLRQSQTEVKAPSVPGTPMPGALVQHFDFGNQPNAGSASEPLDSRSPVRNIARTLDLSHHRSLAVRLDVESTETPSTVNAPVLCVQLESSDKTFRDYYINLDFTGVRTVVMTSPDSTRMMDEFRPSPANYPFKSALAGFDYSRVSAVNLRWMRYDAGKKFRCRIELIEALEEKDVVVRDIDISDGRIHSSISGQMRTGDYAEYWGDGVIRIFDSNGKELSRKRMPATPDIQTGENQISVSAGKTGMIAFTVIAVGR